ncbi:hypothetical protein ILUMI_09348 [Ignelater luminosus]|uniref:Hexosyltransferase n=1 Tax=Ignelater luminosus TaxID=2038154 RepID=A0A8K0D4F1_IGNLU|nr:hypothetical protein ILUMI_09348 [Ignelater luminosus]
MIKKKFSLNFICVCSGLIIFLAIWQIGVIVIPIIFSSSSSHFKNFPSYTLNDFNSSYNYPMERLLPSDYTKLMNVKSFKFHMLSECTSSLLLLITVFSAPTNFEQRISIRETWGKSRKDTKIVFIIGCVDNMNVHKKLEEENKKYQDLIQGGFSDISVYKTYKYITAFKYVIYHCPEVKFILKVNDDVFVHIYAVLYFLNVELSPYGAKNLLFCTPVEKATEKQNMRIKWISPFPEYNDSYFPPYCQEWSSLYSPDVIFILYEELQKMKHFWVEDLLTTGVLAKRAKVPCISTRGLTLFRDTVDKILKKSQWEDEHTRLFLYAEPSITPKKMYSLWKIFENPHTNSILKPWHS